MVSRWLWPENRTFFERASMVVTWWIVAFCAVLNLASWCWWSYFWLVNIQNDKPFYSENYLLTNDKQKVFQPPTRSQVRLTLRTLDVFTLFQSGKQPWRVCSPSHEAHVWHSATRGYPLGNVDLCPCSWCIHTSTRNPTVCILPVLEQRGIIIEVSFGLHVV